jgi:hypothetical protein
MINRINRRIIIKTDKQAYLSLEEAVNVEEDIKREYLLLEEFNQMLTGKIETNLRELFLLLCIFGFLCSSSLGQSKYEIESLYYFGLEFVQEFLIAALISRDYL